jgi:hypothetical protein
VYPLFIHHVYGKWQMHPIETEQQRLVTAGFPGAFVYIEDRDGTSRFFTVRFADLQTQRGSCRFHAEENSVIPPIRVFRQIFAPEYTAEIEHLYTYRIE